MGQSDYGICRHCVSDRFYEIHFPQKNQKDCDKKTGSAENSI